MSTIIGATTVQALRILRSWGMSREQANRFLAMDDREIRVAEVISADCAFRQLIGDDRLQQWMTTPNDSLHQWMKTPNGWLAVDCTPIQQLLNARDGLDWLRFKFNVESEGMPLSIDECEEIEGGEEFIEEVAEIIREFREYHAPVILLAEYLASQDEGKTARRPGSTTENGA